jgi:hypothetical protein
MPGSLGKSAGLPPFPRRYKAVLGLALSILTLTYLLSALGGPSTIPVPAAVREHLPDHIPQLPQLPNAISNLNPFSLPAHRPPVQSNSSSGGVSWHADYRWLLSFSKLLTHDEDRVVLPPIRNRPPIYTYYEQSPKDDKDVKEAEERLILQWRRAWWAQGFKPVVLGRKEALKNPLYAKMDGLRLEDNFELELARWLAWGNMGTGIMADYRLFPMADRENTLLSFLRRGQYPILTRYERLKSGLYCGEKSLINQAIEKAIGMPNIKSALHFADAMFSDMFRIESSLEGVAYYDKDTIVNRYKEVSEPLFGADKVQGLRLLGKLINHHLQTTWQSTINELAVLKPLPEHTARAIDPALQLAHNLTACPSTQASTAQCPPNRPKCKPCTPSAPLTITTPSALHNKTSKFYLGTASHPFTTTALLHPDAAVDAGFIRGLGFSGRDAWLAAVAADQKHATTETHLALLKGAVASDWALSRALWITAEDDVDYAELQWVFGFTLPVGGSTPATTPAKGEEKVDQEKSLKGASDAPPPKPKVGDGVAPAVKAVEGDNAVLQDRRIGIAREALRSKDDLRKSQVAAVEAWSPGDMEAWKFVRAFAARRTKMRRDWDDGERGYAGTEKKGGWGRWFDY